MAKTQTRIGAILGCAMVAATVVGAGTASAGQSGSIRVPLDRANPGLGATTVAYEVLARRDRSRPSLGTIVPNPGGPGVAVVGRAAGYAEQFASLRERRDVLLVDPRGTGRSDLVSCPAQRDAGLAFAPRQELVASIGACGRSLGRRAGWYGSAAIADDVEAVRAALGLDRLDLWGDSYGTYLWQVYAARHPEHVRSIVLSGTYPIDFDSWGRDRLGAARRGIRLVCARTRACDGEAVLRDVARLATRLRLHPLEFTTRVGARRIRTRLDEGDLAALLYLGGDATPYGRVPGAVSSALAGDTALLRRLVEAPAMQIGAMISVAEAGRFFSTAQSFAGQCHDYPRAFSYADTPAVRRAAYEQARAAIDPREFWPFSPQGWTQAGFEGADMCIDWPGDPTAGSPVPSGTPMPDVPVLVLSGDLDANTPSFAGRQAAAQFRRSTFVEVPNVAHTPTAHSPCAAALGVRFIRTLTANPHTCDGTGTPPPVIAPMPRRAAELGLARGSGRRSERRALALVGAVVADLQDQAPTLETWGTAAGLRAGRYVAHGTHGTRLLGVQVVRDARVSGVLASNGRGLSGTLRLSGPGVPAGHLRVRLQAAGASRAVGVLGGRPVDISFRP